MISNIERSRGRRHRHLAEAVYRFFVFRVLTLFNKFNKFTSSKKKNASNCVSIQSRQHFAKLCYRFALKARHSDPRHSQPPWLLLSKAVIIARYRVFSAPSKPQWRSGATCSIALPSPLGVAHRTCSSVKPFARLALQAFGRFAAVSAKAMSSVSASVSAAKFRDQRHGRGAFARTVRVYERSL